MQLKNGIDLLGRGVKRFAQRVNQEIVAIEPISNSEQEALLKSLLEGHLEATGSAVATLADSEGLHSHGESVRLRLS